MAEPHEPQKKPPGAAYFRRLSIGVIAVVFGGLALWSVLAPIDGAVVAAGQVVVEGNRKAVQHLEGGVVGEILVREGQFVEAGDLVVRLEDTVPRANFQTIEGQLAELYARRGRLIAECNDLDLPAEAQGVRDIIESAAFRAKAAGQAELFFAKRNTRTTQISLLEERIVQQIERIAGLKAQIDSLASQRTLILDELEGVRELHKEGYAPKTRLRALEREAKRLDGEGGALKAGVAEATSIIAEARLEIVRIKETAREDSIAELRDAEVSIAELEERRVTALDALKRTEIRAPRAGRVLALSVHTVGGVIAPGASLMEIVPEDDRLQIAARVEPADIDKVARGQETLIRFSAFGARATPEATGVVATVSADSLADDATGAPYYLALVDLPANDEMSAILRGQPLAPGMPAETFIRTGARPAISYFLKPLTDAFARSLKEE
ncbi:MAG: HlyD family type I secretion periplasmic adaptor subunit [Amphiplicatus sp.]